MKLGRLDLLCAALAFSGLAACSGSGTTVPGAGPGTSTTSSQARSVPSAYGDALRASLYGTGMHAAPNTRRGWISPDAKAGKNIIYVGNYDTNTIWLWSTKGSNQQPLGEITDGLSSPERLFVDKKLNLYATNIGNSNVTEYAPGGTSPSFTISTGVDNPTGITVGADGTVYVANVGNGTVTEYKKGKTSPFLTIPAPAGEAENLAVDSNNNLYTSTFNGVYEVAPGQTTGTDLNLSLNSTGGAIAVDTQGNIIIADSPNVDIFPAGQTSPSKTVAFSFPFELSLNKKQNTVYVSDLDSSFSIKQFSYPSGTNVKVIVNNPTDNGWPLAVSPDLVN